MKFVALFKYLLKNAFLLHENWPESQLIFVNSAAGHSALELGITKELTNATEKMRHLLTF